jgi:hypothetical protein
MMPVAAVALAILALAHHPPPPRRGNIVELVWLALVRVTAEKVSRGSAFFANCMPAFNSCAKILMQST